MEELSRAGISRGAGGAAIALAWLLCGPAAAQTDPTPEELEQWFTDDAEQRALAVNEGELAFLDPPPDKRVPHSRNTLVIDAAGIDSGWVALTQCYDGLDPVGEAEVVYQYREMQGLAVTRAEQIGEARVQGQSVQLRDVGRGAELCIRARVRILRAEPEGTLSLVNGPYHRRFLDGYYPLHVSLDVRYPAERLDYVDADPAPQPGLTVRATPGRVVLDAWFEGRLDTRVRFRRR